MTTRRETLTGLVAAIGLGLAGCGEPGKVTEGDRKGAIDWSKVDGAGFDRPAPVGEAGGGMRRVEDSGQAGKGTKGANDTSGAEPNSKAEPGKQDGGPR